MKKEKLLPTTTAERIRFVKILFMYAIFIGQCLTAFAQSPGDIDLSFGNPVSVLGDSSRFVGRVNAILLQNDGKIIAGGGFTNYNGVTKNRIARLNKDGSPDPSFLVASGFNGEVNALAFGTGGKIYAGGNFTTIEAQPYARLARLNANGTLDGSFAVGSGFNAPISSIAIQNDGKIILAGSFTSYKDTVCNRIVRLNPNGTIDKSFTFGTGFNNAVYKAVLQEDGKIIIGGEFTNYNGTARNRIIRINPEGTIDNSFNIGNGFNSYVQALAIQNDGKILIGGNFTSYAGNVVTRICRLASNGGLDGNFKTGTGLNASPSVITLFNDKIYLGGGFSTYNNLVARQIFRLNADGTIDPGFSRKFGANANLTGGYVSSIVIEPSGNALIAGSFENYFNTLRNNIARIQPDGWPTPHFSVAYGFDNGTLLQTRVNSIAIQYDGKLLIGGRFTTYDGFHSPGLVRLFPNGKIDTSFYQALSGSAEVEDVKIDTVNQKIFIAGYFSSVNGVSRNNIARLTMNGNLDNGFSTGKGFNTTVNRLAVLADGKVIAVGNFSSYDNTPSGRIASLNANGSLDLSFVTGLGLNNYAYDIEVQKDGKILLGGYFTQYNGTNSPGIARLNANGTIDASFLVGTGFTGINSTVRNITLQQNGKILCVGSFNDFNGTDLQNVARLNTDGSIDNTFTPLGADNLNASLVMDDGKVLISGAKQDLSKRIACFDDQGITEASFNAGTGFDDAVKVFALQDDGKILVGGIFTSYNGYSIYKLARLHGYGLPTGMEEVSFSVDTQNWLLYPNPVTTDFTVRLIDKITLPAKLTLTNIFGETVDQFEVTQALTSFDLDQPAGTYFATLSNNKEAVTKKIIIQRK